MTTHNERTEAPDADDLARSMLQMLGHDHPAAHLPDRTSTSGGSWSKAPDFASDPAHAAALHAATEQDRQRYLTSGLTPVDCRFCHATVSVKKLGPEYTAVQWNSEASGRCAYFASIRAEGGDSNRAPSCPRLSDSIKHAVAEGCLEAVSSAPSPGDG